MKTHHAHDKNILTAGAELAFDVVCGMEVDQKQSHHHIQHHGTVYYFCSSHCKQHFIDAPTRYVGEQ